MSNKIPTPWLRRWCSNPAGDWNRNKRELVCGLICFKCVWEDFAKEQQDTRQIKKDQDRSRQCKCVASSCFQVCSCFYWYSIDIVTISIYLQEQLLPLSPMGREKLGCIPDKNQRATELADRKRVFNTHQTELPSTRRCLAPLFCEEMSHKLGWHQTDFIWWNMMWSVSQRCSQYWHFRASMTEMNTWFSFHLSENVSSQWLRYIPHMFSHHVIQQWQKFLQEVVRISRWNLAIQGMDVDLLYCWVPLFFHSSPSTCHRLPQGCGARKMCLPVQDVQGWRDSQMAPSMSCRNRWMGAASYSKFLAFFWTHVLLSRVCVMLLLMCRETRTSIPKVWVLALGSVRKDERVTWTGCYDVLHNSASFWVTTTCHWTLWESRSCENRWLIL